MRVVFPKKLKAWSGSSSRPEAIEYVTVAHASQLAPGQVIGVQAGERWYALANVDGKLYAIDNNCPHMGGPLSKGTLKGNVITCPWHAWQWEVTSGRNRWPGTNWRAPTVPVRVLPNGDIQLPLI
jgi:nitrite reductase (NADH) small subunit/3-phenylpropionate/trans-cinnamate dioxygenase ferredoxin subunit